MSEQTGQGARTLRVTLKRSLIGRPKDQGDTVRSLRLRKIHQSTEHPDTPSIRGMIYKVRHLVEVEEIPG